MESLTINLNGDGILEGTKPEDIVHIKHFTVSSLEGGMQSGLPSVAIIADLPDGKKLFMETSMRLFCSSADALKAKYGDLLTPRHG